MTNDGSIAGGFGGTSGGTNTTPGGDGLVNSGTITTQKNSGTIMGAVAGELNVGTIGSLDNLTGGVISGAQYGVENVGVILTLDNAGVISDPGFAVFSKNSIKQIANSGRIIGNVEIDNQAAVTVTGGPKTYGVWTGGTITIGNSNLSFAGGKTALDENIVVDGGAGTVFNKDPLSINSPMTITGNFGQAPTGELDFMVGGDMAGQYGALTVTGATTLDGTVALDLTNGFQLAPGDGFDFLDPLGRLDGAFSGFSIDGHACAAGSGDVWNCGDNVTFAPNVTHGLNGVVDLTVISVPEPSTWALLDIGFLGLSGLALRRRSLPLRL
jgi:hypothetical protein